VTQVLERSLPQDRAQRLDDHFATDPVLTLQALA
jgi:predicted methyltransferase